jgi:hypothetical protein
MENNKIKFYQKPLFVVFVALVSYGFGVMSVLEPEKGVSAQTGSNEQYQVIEVEPQTTEMPEEKRTQPAPSVQASQEVTPVETPIAQNSVKHAIFLPRQEALVIIKENAGVKWKDDYKMVSYEISQQTAAYDWLIKQAEYPDIMKRAYSKWGHDYKMVKYEYENQVKAYLSI